MAANTNPLFTLTPVIGMAQISTANTLRDGSGTTLATGGTYGTRIDRVTVTATAATTAGMVRLSVYDGANGRLFAELPVTAVAAPSGTVAAFTATMVFDRGLILPPTWVLRVSTHNAETFNVFAIGGDF